jgi:hypothetical protein
MAGSIWRSAIWATTKAIGGASGWGGLASLGPLRRLDFGGRQTLQLGWSPSWNLQNALQNITQWHRAWLNQENMKKLCLDQILQYSIAMQTKAI